MCVKKKKECLNREISLPVTLLIIYLAMLALCIALYALIQIFVDDKGTATNLMIWSATLFAPIAVFYGFRTWKNQQFEQSKIKAIENLKEKVSEFNKITFDYRFLSMNLKLLRDGKSEEFDNLMDNWIQKSESLRRDIMSILETDGFYFHSGNDELNRLYELNNNLMNIINVIENAGFILKICWIGTATPSPINEGDTAEKILIRNKYLIDISDYINNLTLEKDPEIRLMCIEFEKKIIQTPIKDFFSYLNSLLYISFNK